MNFYAQWSNIGNAGISTGWTVFNDIATDTSDAPVIVYRENTLNNASCLRYNGIQWVQVGPSSFTFPLGDNFQFKINTTDNTYYLFYYDNQNSYLSCIKYNGTSWNYAGSQYLASEVLTAYAVAFDTTGVMHCAFYGSGGLVLLHENGPSWQTINTLAAPTNMAWLSLAFDGQNNPIIAYTNVNTLKANVIKLNGNTWQSLGNADFSSGYAQYLKLNVTVNDEIFIAFHDNLTQCFKLNTIQDLWQQMGIPGLDGNYAFIDDLISDGSGRIYISTSQMASDRARCLMFNGSNWIQPCGLSISDTTASYPNITIDKSGIIYSTYNDYILGKAFVRKCDNPVSINELSFARDITIYPNPACNKFQLLLENFNFNSRIEIRDITGGLIYSETINTDSINVDVSHFANGLYMIFVYDTIKTSYQKLIVNN